MVKIKNKKQKRIKSQVSKGPNKKKGKKTELKNDLSTIIWMDGICGRTNIWRLVSCLMPSIFYVSLVNLLIIEYNLLRMENSDLDNHFCLKSFPYKKEFPF